MVLCYKIQVFENVEGCFANMRYIPVSLNLHSFLPCLYNIKNRDQIYPWPNPHRVVSGHRARWPRLQSAEITIALQYLKEGKKFFSDLML